MKLKIRLLVIFTVTMMLSLVMAASSFAYLHVANAQEYAKAHMWNTLCKSRGCRDYPWSTGWYQRINSNEVRVEVKDYVYGDGYCWRIFDVRGNDGPGNMYISTAGSAAFYSCN